MNTLASPFSRKYRVLGCLLALLLAPVAVVGEERIDASDPTKIYTFVGIGPKYTDYSNGESMWEMRISGNAGLSENDMLLFELGYGQHSGNKVPGANSTLTNARTRWFHLFDIDYGIRSGYRGWGTQVDLQIAGRLKGTDGQNVLSLGILPAFGINEHWSFFLPMNLVNTWDKKFEKHNGVGINISPLFSYAPEDWWDGAFVQFWPGYTRFVSGDLSGEGSGVLLVTMGGEITSTMLWTVTTEKFLDKYLRSYRRDQNAGLNGDWNIFLNVSSYF